MLVSSEDIISTVTVFDSTDAKTHTLKLLSWAFGDLEYIEEITERKYDGKPLPCRVYTMRGLKDQDVSVLPMLARS